MKYFLFLTVLLFFSASLFPGTISGKVVRIADGDTITILDDSKAQHKIRFEHIDTPEKKQAFGEKAKQYLSSMIFGKTVKVVIKEKDRYGRNIGTVFLDKKNINLAMVKAGLAWHYKFYSKDKSFAEAEIESRKNKIGLWADPKPIPPWEFRRKK
jgi:endonuclease YncB( thermonuclease family)